MFQHRELGLNQAYQICCTVLISILYWAYYFFLNELVPTISLAGLGNYFEYFIALLLGFQISFLSKRQQDIFSVTSGVVESHRVVRPHITFAAAITFMFLVLTKDDAVSRVFLFTFLPLAYFALVIFTRYFAFPFLHYLQRDTHQKLLLVGKASELDKVQSLIAKARFFGLTPIGMVTESPEKELTEDLPKLGEPGSLASIIALHKVGNILILGSPRERGVLREWFALAENLGCRVSMVNDLDQFLQRQLSYFQCDEVDLIELRTEPLLNPVNRTLKRIFDMVLSLPVVCLILPPLMLVVWILQRRQAPGNLIFRQVRSGIDNQPFTILKFRTMYADQCNGSEQVRENDGRVFPGGHFLRRFSLDEFPQFLNVLTGHMSLVGPRPHMVQHDEVFARTMSQYPVRSFAKPGVSGLAQIRGFRGEAASDEDVIRRVEADIEYIENWSIMLDVRIIWQTLLQIFKPPKSAK